jgi:hypothetical protein
VSNSVYIGGTTQAWLLNDLTWQRVVALANGQRLSRTPVRNIADALTAARDDPDAAQA